MAPDLTVTSPLTRGPDVLQIQQRLGALGFAPGGLDGVFGPATAAAVRAFQGHAGLDADGIVGPRTRAALAALARPAPAPTSLTPPLKANYVALWKSCAVRPARAPEVEAVVSRIVANRQRYAAAGKADGVPWYVVGAIHSLEADLDFGCHLHNGDPLTARTVNVPPGRPPAPHPPFTWEQSAADALAFDGLAAWKDWSLGGMLYVIERYNGFGYRDHHPDVPSPYLWSFSNHYTQGKYVADGSFSPTAVSEQAGAAVLLHRMAERGLWQPA